MDGLKVKKKLLDSGFQLNEIADKIGITPQDLQSKLRSKDLKTSFLIEISNAINKSVYFFINDSSVKPKIQENSHVESVKKSVKNTENTKSTKKLTLSETPTEKESAGIPLIPIEAMAGWGTGEVQVMDYEMGLYKVPEFDNIKVDFMIRARGSSMYPKYNSGDTLACLKVELGVFFQWNKVYVLDTSQGAMVKRIKKSDKENHILCVSDNPNYDPFDLPLEDLYAIALVVGVIRLE